MAPTALHALSNRLARIDVRRSATRVGYYLRHGIEDAVVGRRHIDLAAELDKRSGPDADDILDRVNYCNRLPPGTANPPGTRLDALRKPRRKSYYYYDLKALTRYFDGALSVATLFGDISHIPDQPAILKSRPISDLNANSVVMKLNVLRHYYLYRDRIPFERKLPKAVWRGGGPSNPKRKALVARWGDNPRFDIAFADYRRLPEGYLAVPQLLRHRYMISIEGNDVATNLKWIMASNALCLMPRPALETWFMEGRLQAGVHYVELRNDCEDLAEKVDHYEAHPDEAREIIANANAWVRQFFDVPRERLINLLVLRKYFEMTGQLPRQFF